MASLTSLKQALREEVALIAPPSSRIPLPDLRYSKAFKTFMGGLGSAVYGDFIIPQLSQLLQPLFNSRPSISVLEIGPGPKSPLGHLPDRLKRKIKRYVAFEPNELFVTELKEWISHGSDGQSPLQQPDMELEICHAPFMLEKVGVGSSRDGENRYEGQFDVVLFCHSMYGMKPKRNFIERALEMLKKGPQGGIVAVFHRDEVLSLDGLVCHRTATFPAGQVRVADKDDDLDHFASLIAGFAIQDTNVDQAVRTKWREVCRKLGSRDTKDLNSLLFRSPETMLAFTHHSTHLKELIDQVPRVQNARAIKNWEAQNHTPAAIVRPTEIQHIQYCVQWALKHGLGLTVIGGGHSGQCIWSNIVAVDMSAFEKIHIHMADETDASDPEPGPLVFVEAGCKTGDIVHETMAVGLALPLGDRPSVGIGLLLQGGIGHLSRLYGLACDAIVGAVMVSVANGQPFCIGNVPSQHWPAGAVRPECESDLLWAIKGAGTNFGIVVGITCKAFAAPSYSFQNWVIPLNGKLEAQKRLGEFDRLVANRLPSSRSADAFLFFDSGRLNLAATVFDASTTEKNPSTILENLDALWGPGDGWKISNGVELFDAGLYVSGMHGGHAGGKTSSFKRCIFLKSIGRIEIIDRLMYAIENCPSPFCYVHLLQGGGIANEIIPNGTAFGCREWDFACVITGVWPRDQDGSESARTVVQWVYQVAEDLLPVSDGVYGADLGPDPRDIQLARMAFGPNLPFLARLKRKLDPKSLLAYACPLPKAMHPKVIILVTGEECSGKDFCAEVWANWMTAQGLTALVTRISDRTKREYAAATGADFNLLIRDRAYKDMHRQRLTRFFLDQVQCRPELPEEHFQNVIDYAGQIDVLFVTGMREEAPVAKMSHLVPGSKLIEVNIQTGLQTQTQQGKPGSNSSGKFDISSSGSRELSYHPDLVFNNSMAGKQEVQRFAEQHLFAFFHNDLQQLNEMILTVSDFPSPGFEFRHVLGISQQPGGLGLCTSLLHKHFTGDWNKVDAIASCEAGGFVYASALAFKVNVPLILIREAGKLPPPTVSTGKSSSYVASSTSGRLREQRIELEQGAVPKGGSVVVIDDVLSTGQTLCAVLRLLNEAGIPPENLSVVVVAEFPVHHGRDLLRQSGFAKTSVQSLLVFGSA